MQIILQLLDNSSLIQDYNILNYRQAEDMQYIKIKAKLIDGTELRIREYISVEDRNYSYHWQKQNGDLIIRWDNAPHHPNLSTHPHHKHDPDPMPSHEIKLEDVLVLIGDRLNE